MLNRSAILSLIMLHNRENNIFAQLPLELIRDISEFGQNSGSDFSNALTHVARGELPEAKAILDTASKQQDKTKLKELLLSSGTAVTRCGITVKSKTLLECALGEGDQEVIERIKSYFPLFEGGYAEMEKQLARYRPCFLAIQNQKPDDLKWLFEILKKSSAQDVRAELATGEKYDVSYQSELRTALNKFREDRLNPKGRVITKPRMHCNYQNLTHAYNMLVSYWYQLKVWDPVTGQYNEDKCKLAARQIIGFIKLTELPARERYLSARDQIDEEASGKTIIAQRLMDYKYGGGSFPDFDAALVKSHTGLGFNSNSSIYGGCIDEGEVEVYFNGGCSKLLEGLWKLKTSELQNLCSSPQNQTSPVRNLLK